MNARYLIFYQFYKIYMKTIFEKGGSVIVMTFFVALLFWSPFFSIANAQVLSSNGIVAPEGYVITPSTAVVVATVNVQNLDVVKTADNTMTVDFDISNRVGVQPAVLYAVKLVSSDKSGRLSVVNDQQVYTKDILTLNENVSIHKKIVYIVPTYLKGSFIVRVETQTPEGLSLSSIDLREKVSLDGGASKGGLFVDAGSCFLTVKGEVPEKKYVPLQGIDVSSTEVLLAHCSVKNNFTEQKSFTPMFATYYRSTLGNLIAENSQSVITLKAGETRMLELPITLAIKPQAYDVVLSLVNGQKERVTSPVIFHYVLRGESATIQNLILDKDAYQKGETAHVSFFWTGPADVFYGSRATNVGSIAGGSLTLSIVDEKGVSCGEKTLQKLSSGDRGVERVSILITKNCYNSTIRSSIMNQAGAVLVENVVKMTSASSSPVEEIATTTEPVSSNKNGIIAIVITIVVLIVIGGGAYVFKKKQNMQNNMMMFLLFGMFVFAGLFGGSHKASADVLTVQGVNPLGQTVWVDFSYGLDRSTYSPGSTITAHGSFVQFNCSNGYSNYLDNDFSNLYATINNSYKEVTPKSTISSATTYQTYTAPTIPGSYNAQFVGWYYRNKPLPAKTWYSDFAHGVGLYPYTVSGPTTVSFWSSKTSLRDGDPVTLYWDTNGTSCTGSGDIAWNGSKAGGSGNSYTFTPTLAGSPHTYNISCTGLGGNATTEPIVVEVLPAGALLDVSFTVDPPSSATVKVFDDVKLSWTSTGAFDCAGTGPWGWGGGNKPTSGTKTLTVNDVDGPYTFGIICRQTNPIIKFSTQKTVTVNVSTPAPNVTFSADSTIINQGETATVRWFVSNPDVSSSCTATGGDPSGSWTTPAAKNRSGGVQSFTLSNPGGPYTYTLTCTGPTGKTTVKTAQITIAALADPKIRDFSVSTTTVIRGTNTNVFWNAENVDGCGRSGTYLWFPGGISGSQVLTPASTFTGTMGLWCYSNITGKQISTSTPFNVIEPSVNIWAGTNPLDSGDSTTLYWQSNVGDCAATGAWIGTKVMDGSEPISPTSDSTYTITCSGPGGPISKSVTVVVNPVIPPPPFSFSSDYYNVGRSNPVNTSVKLTWEGTTNSCTRSSDYPSTPAWSGSHTAGVGGSGNLTVTPQLNKTTEFKLTCDGVTKPVIIYSCGNLKCESGENFANCKSDCKYDYKIR
jgi:hypothetical protein